MTQPLSQIFDTNTNQIMLQDRELYRKEQIYRRPNTSNHGNPTRLVEETNTNYDAKYEPIENHTHLDVPSKSSRNPPVGIVFNQAFDASAPPPKQMPNLYQEFLFSQQYSDGTIIPLADAMALAQLGNTEPQKPVAVDEISKELKEQQETNFLQQKKIERQQEALSTAIQTSRTMRETQEKFETLSSEKQPAQSSVQRLVGKLTKQQKEAVEDLYPQSELFESIESSIKAGDIDAFNLADLKEFAKSKGIKAGKLNKKNLFDKVKSRL